MSNADEDRARERLANNMKESATRIKADVAASEARKKRSKRPLPHLIEYQGATRCSICKMPFASDAAPSQQGAFVEHVRRAHRPGQKSEDSSLGR